MSQIITVTKCQTLEFDYLGITKTDFTTVRLWTRKVLSKEGDRHTVPNSIWELDFSKYYLMSDIINLALRRLPVGSSTNILTLTRRPQYFA